MQLNLIGFLIELIARLIYAIVILTFKTLGILIPIIIIYTIYRIAKGR